jgi:hypothetical protein
VDAGYSRAIEFARSSDLQVPMLRDEGAS